VANHFANMDQAADRHAANQALGVDLKAAKAAAAKED
jgi:hypothetical protein